MHCLFHTILGSAAILGAFITLCGYIYEMPDISTVLMKKIVHKFVNHKTWSSILLTNLRKITTTKAHTPPSRILKPYLAAFCITKPNLLVGHIEDPLINIPEKKSTI